MDDFDFDEEELQREQQQQQQDDTNIVDKARDTKDKYDKVKDKYDRLKGAKDKYNGAKDGVDGAQNFRQGARQAAKGTSEAASKGAGTAAKGAGQAAAKEAGKTAAKEAGKTAAKEAGKLAAKEGAKTAARGALAASGAATAGVGTAAAAAMAARDQLKKVGKKLSNKVDNAIESSTGLKLKGKKKFIIILIIFLIIFVIINTGSMYLASENTYDDLYAIIKKRQARYAESGKTFKSVLLMTNAEINEILSRDYLEQGQSVSDKNYIELDLCYKTYLKSIYKEEYDNYIPSDSNDPNDTYAEKLKIIDKYLKASRTNFNKIKWVISSGGSVEVKNYDLKDNLSDVTALLMNATNNYLSMPNLTKYKFSPSATPDEMKTMYLDMVEKYLQPWVVPYALNIASQDNNFGKSVLDDMYHPITVTLYKLDRLIKTTTTYYYLETTVKVDHYVEEEYDCSDDDDDGEDECSTRWVYSSTSYQDSTTATTWEDTNEERYSVSLKSGSDGYIRAGIKSGPAVERDKKPYRHVPKLTYAETFYDVITGNYTIKPINESEVPVERSVTLDSDGKEIIIEKWDENLLDNGTKSKPYKVSYIGEENETFPRKSKTQKEQIKKKYVGIDATDTEEAKGPEVQGYSYDDLSFGFTQIEKYYNTASTGGIIGSGSLTSVPEGGFGWPVPAVLGNGITIDKTISSPYGMRDSGMHYGIDIMAMGIGKPGIDESSCYGPAIVASQKGIVHVKSDPSGYGPEYIVIDHQNGYFTLYGHLYSVSVTDGQEVTQGQTIGVMGTKGRSSGVHLHFEIIKADSLENVFNNDNKLNPAQFYNADGSAIGGITNTGTSVAGTTSSGQSVIDQMCAKAIDMAENVRNIIYKFGGETVSTIEELTKNPWNTDCSGFVSSMYKAYVGIDTGRGTGVMMDKANAGYSESGWTAEYHDWDGDTSVLLPGDMLINSHHVGLYVGNGQQVDNGGSPVEGPNYKDARGTYTGYIRYTNPNVVTSTASTNSGSTSSSSDSGGKKISRIEWYLDWQTAKNDLTGTGTGTSSTGLGSSDLISFLKLAEGGTSGEGYVTEDGTKYIVHNDGAAIPTIGMGVAIKYNLDAFAEYGIDGTTLNFGDTVDKSIVDAVAQKEIDKNVGYVNDLLASNGITDLKDYQIAVLVSRTYNCGNISGFPSAYKQYGMTQGLWDNYMSTPVTGEGKGVLEGLVSRRKAEWELFTTGVYPDTVY